MSGEDSIRSFPVPDLGEGLQEVTVTCWSVAVGDDVEINQTLCSVETAKAEVEIPSPYAGRIVELGGAEGDVLKVGAELVRIDTGPTAVAQPNGEGAVPTLVGYGADAAIETSRRTSRPLAAPVVRKLAKELAVDLAALQRGSGAGGVITRADVLAAARGGVGAGPDVRPVHGVHARMAEKMTLSHKEIPTAKASVEVICAELLRLRDRFVSAAPEITPFALTLRLLVIALKHNVILNSTWVDSGEGPQVHVHRGVHLGFGAATERGLLVPVVTDAQDKNTRELASRVAELITGAREGTLHTRGAARFDVHGVELRGAGSRRRRAGDQPSRSGDPGSGGDQAAPGGRRRRGCRTADDDVDLCVRPPRCRWCSGGPVHV